jgi:hypothetical protein
MNQNDIITNAVDQLGILRSQIAGLKKQEDTLVASVRLSMNGDQVLDGNLFRATLVVQMRESLVADKVRAFLHPNQLRAATRVTEVQSLKLTARS